MTYVTLSIDDNVYKRMKKHSEIKWSEFARKAIKKRLDELEKLSFEEKESLLTMLASEESLKKEWDNVLDNRWDNV
jgi:predicted CopG family antitoxin